MDVSDVPICHDSVVYCVESIADDVPVHPETYWTENRAWQRKAIEALAGKVSVYRIHLDYLAVDDRQGDRR